MSGPEDENDGTPQVASRVVFGEIATDGTLGDVIGPGLGISATAPPSEPTSPFGLLLYLDRVRADGMLGLEGGDETIGLTVSSGWILRARSSAETDDESLALTLLDERILTRDRLLRAAAEVERSGEELGRALYKLSYLDAKMIARGLRRTVRRLLRRALAMPKARFTFARQDVLGGSRLRESPTRVAIRAELRSHIMAVLRGYHYTELTERLVVYRERYLEVPERWRGELRKLGFDKQQMHTVDELLTGAYTPKEIARMTVMSKNGLCRLLVGLGGLCLLDAHEEPTAEAKVFSEEQRLCMFLENLERCDHFERLGSHWTAHVEQIRAEHENLCRDYGPGGRYSLAGGPLAVLAAQIWSLMEESWSVVREPARRQSHRNEVADPARARHAAELLIDQGRTLELQARWDDARMRYEAAQEICSSDRAKQALRQMEARIAAWAKRQRERAE